MSKLEKLNEQFQNIIDNQDKFTKHEYIERLQHYKGMIDKQTMEVKNHKSAFDYFSESIKQINTIVAKPRGSDSESTESSDEDDSNICSICMDNFTIPISYLKKCGHYFCQQCLDSVFALSEKTIKCPYCRQQSDKSDIVIVNEVADIVMSPKSHEVMKIIKESDPSNKYIIFTQFDKMFDKFDRLLNKYGINTMCYQNYLLCDNKDPVQVILLSSSQNAEGINLSMFDQIIIYEPFEDSMYCREIEKQLIGRIHRVGRVGEVKVTRLITANTIEQDIYYKLMY